MEIHLRSARQDEIPRIVQLWMRMMDEHHRFEPYLQLSPLAAMGYENYLQIHLRNPRSLVLVALDGDAIVGFCCAYICQNLPMFLPSEFGYLSDIYIAPGYRNQGVGKRIMDHVRDWMRSQGAHSIQLQVYRNNIAGRDFWNAQGFAPFFDRLWADLDQDTKPDE